MLGYWLAVVRRLAPPALATGAVCAAVATAALVLGDGTPWSGAVPQALAAGAVVALAFAAVLSASTVVSAARTARRYGFTLGPEAVALPSVRAVRVPAIAGRTAFQLTDSVRYAVERDPVLRLDEITAFGHGTLELTLRGPSDTTVSVQVRVTTGPKETAVVVEARPAARYKRLDAAACWAVARAVEERVAQALRAEAADGTAAR
ncbi:hypothetical protein AB0O01_01450 [Streptomyces sp. NPDC093252]|uniref:hypothetical protein n=1 Tax=Streptomyces sp. NPDC093252 TaxID=3154980 RepID=UPI00342771FD